MRAQRCEALQTLGVTELELDDDELSFAVHGDVWRVFLPEEYPVENALILGPGEWECQKNGCIKELVQYVCKACPAVLRNTETTSHTSEPSDISDVEATMMEDIEEFEWIEQECRVRRVEDAQAIHALVRAGFTDADAKAAVDGVRSRGVCPDPSWYQRLISSWESYTAIQRSQWGQRVLQHREAMLANAHGETAHMHAVRAL